MVNVDCPPGLGGAAGSTSNFFAQEYRALDADNRINKPISCLHALLTVLLVLKLRLLPNVVPRPF
jgi:hypothetical protein